MEVKSISYQFRNTLPLGEVRASNLALSSRFGISKYPTLLVMCDENGSAVIAYEGEFKVKHIAIFLDGLKSGKACEAARSKLKNRANNIKENFHNLDFSKVSKYNIIWPS